MIEPKFTIGNTSGQYFTEWRFELLRDLAREIVRRMIVDEFHLDYDQSEDYHCLTFSRNGRNVLVRFYKIFACVIDGNEQDVWRVNRHYPAELAEYIKDKTLVIHEKT